MSYSGLLKTGTAAPYKNLNVNDVTANAITASTLEVGNITSTGALSGTNLTPYGLYMRVNANGTSGSSFGNMNGTLSKEGTGHYKYTYATTLPRVPFSIQITPDQRSTENPTLWTAFVTFSTQGILEWKTKDNAGNAIDGSVYIAIMG